ncbi:hypothetical protein ACIO6T_43470 [Streptomyces sp. NPDC087532]|uniref:hypothetical protein n=1 Tax=Streptomyces sp. NPDC087532 TaxID=3365795 RepID=UPI003828B473
MSHIDPAAPEPDDGATQRPAGHDAFAEHQRRYYEQLNEAGRRLADVRAVLQDHLPPDAPDDLVNLYTGAVFDAVREWQRPMWGAGYIDPVDGPQRAHAALGVNVLAVDVNSQHLSGIDSRAMFMQMMSREFPGRQK